MSKYCIGIDLGGTFIKFCLLSDTGEATGLFQLPTPSEGGPDAVIQQMAGGAERLLKASDVDRRDILGVGIGSPGPLDLDAGVVREMPNLPGFSNVPIRDRVGEALNMPAMLENDANAAAFGEHLCGAGEGLGDMVLLTLGTGVGGGVIIDGKVFHGAHGMGAELGHMIIVPGGKQCNCGQRGCVEKYCSASNLAQHAMEQVRRRGNSSVLAEMMSAKGSLDARDVQEAMGRSDSLAEELWDRTTYYLALACVNVCRIFDPDEVVLAGGMAKAGDHLIEPVRRHVSELNWSMSKPLTKIAIARLGNDAGVIGAAGVAMQEFADGKSES